MEVWEGEQRLLKSVDFLSKCYGAFKKAKWEWTIIWALYRIYKTEYDIKYLN
jgi:hypothetical protein